MDMSIGIAYRFLDTNTVLTELHDHNYYEYFIVTHGSLEHEVNGNIQKLKTGNMVFIRPKDCHKYNLSDDVNFKLINISFSKKHFDNVCEYFNNSILEKCVEAEMPPVILLPSVQLTSLKKKHYMLNVSANRENLMAQLKTLLIDVFSNFILEYEVQSQADSRQWLHSVLKQMNTPENIEEGLPALLKYSGFSHGHLCRIMKQELGMTPNQYINDLRLKYAANLLATTDYDILSIAMRLGFSSLSYFTTIFKNKYDLTPSKYRSKYSNIYSWK